MWKITIFGYFCKKGLQNWRLWIGIGSFRFQPTELSKIILIVFFAKFFMDHEETLNTLKTLALSGVLLAVACPSGAMDLQGFSNRQIIAEVDAICR